MNNLSGIILAHERDCCSLNGRHLPSSKRVANFDVKVRAVGDATKERYGPLRIEDHSY